MAYARQAMQFFLDRFGLDFTGATAPTAVGPWDRRRGDAGLGVQLWREVMGDPGRTTVRNV
jgi:hypothetical protein